MYRLPVYCNLFVRDMTRTLRFCVPGELTVGVFKKAIAASTGVCRAEQRLIFGNKLLQDSEQCRQYNECNINLCCTLKGGNICNICSNANPDLFVETCEKPLCSGCSTMLHRHPERQNHIITDSKDTSTCTTMGEDSTAYSQSFDLEFFNSLSHDDLKGKCQVAELVEAFGLTQFRDYQRNAINAALNGKHTLIIQ